MSGKRPGWRAAERRFRYLSAILARKAAEEVRGNRQRLADAVCPDGDGCPDPLCIEARAAIMRGADWRAAWAILYPVENARLERAESDTARAVRRRS